MRVCSFCAVLAGLILFSGTRNDVSACDNSIDYEKGTLSSPLYPNYYLFDQECTWIIRASPGSTINLRFKSFEIEYSPSCNYDYVEIHDGPEISSKLLGKFCGHRVPDVITSSGNEMIIRYRSHYSVQRRGFTAAFNTSDGETTGSDELQEGDCGRDIYAENGTIQSPNFPLSYRPLEDCVWTIIVPDGNLVSLKIEALDLEYSSSCSFDNVTLIDGYKEDSPILRTICHYIEMPRFPIISSENKMTVKFSSDDSLEGTGFAASFTKVHACGEFIMADKGILETPKTTDGFGYRCTWRITVPENDTVLLKIHKDKNEDYSYRSFNVHVYDGPDVFSPSLKDYVYLTDPGNIRSTGNEMSVMVTSDGSAGLPHFYAEFEKEFCGGDIIADSGIITSPGYPDEYPPSKDCTWRITVPANHQVVLSFQTFNLEYVLGCKYDFVEVRDGHSPESNLMARACATNIPTNLHSTNNRMSLRFVSDSSGQHRGFSAQFEKAFT